MEQLALIRLRPISLQFLTNKWQRVDHISLWVIDIESSRGPVFFLFALVHAVGWLVIYGGCVIMDLPEIIGLKQASSSLVLGSFEWPS